MQLNSIPEHEYENVIEDMRQRYLSNNIVSINALMARCWLAEDMQRGYAPPPLQNGPRPFSTLIRYLLSPTCM